MAVVGPVTPPIELVVGLASVAATLIWTQSVATPVSFPSPVVTGGCPAPPVPDCSATALYLVGIICAAVGWISGIIVGCCVRPGGGRRAIALPDWNHSEAVAHRLLQYPSN